MWEIVIIPAEKGVIVYVTDGTVRSVVGRVAYSRFDSANKLTSFKRSLRRVIARADTVLAGVQAGDTP